MSIVVCKPLNVLSSWLGTWMCQCYRTVAAHSRMRSLCMHCISQHKPTGDPPQFESERLEQTTDCQEAGCKSAQGSARHPQTSASSKAHPSSWPAPKASHHCIMHVTRPKNTPPGLFSSCNWQHIQHRGSTSNPPASARQLPSCLPHLGRQLADNLPPITRLTGAPSYVHTQRDKRMIHARIHTKSSHSYDTVTK